LKNTAIRIGLRNSSPEVIGGVDEAGRGPVIGPMVICGLVFQRDKLSEIRVRDSKTLTPTRRKILYRKIMNRAEAVSVRIVSPEEIDAWREKDTINSLEAKVFAEVIKDLEEYADVFYVDSADANADRFAQNVHRVIGGSVAIIAEHHADSKYPVVSAASIVAKVIRDREIEKISKEIGFFGSGYPSDMRTVEFIKKWLDEHGEFPPYTRKSWKTLRRIGGENGSN